MSMTGLDGERARRIGLLCLVGTAFGWGLNWPAIKLLLLEWPPLIARGTSGLVAALLLAALARALGEPVALPRTLWRRMVLTSLTNVTAWMGFATVAMVWLSVSEGALLVYTMPLWVLVFAWPLRGTRPTLRAVAAIGLGMAGLAVLLGGNDLAMGAEKLPGILLALGSASLFALGTVLTRQAIPLPPLTLTAWQVGLGCVPMVAYGLVFEAPDIGAVSLRGWLLWAYMALVPMGLCYLGWFAALRRLPPATAATGTLMVPLVGVVSAAILIGEPLGLREAVAVALTLSGVGLAMAR